MNLARNFALAAFLATAGTVAAHAEQSGTGVLFGNTLRVQKAPLSLDFYYEPDGTFSNSVGITGTWTYNGSQLCVHYVDQSSSCISFASDHNIGDSWTAIDSDGNAETFAILEGHTQSQ